MTEVLRRVKALSIVAPGGQLIATGRKTLEVRRWAPAVALGEDLLIIENHRFLHQPGEEDPDGRAVALVRVARLRPFTPRDMKAACAGSFEPGWLAWELTEVRPLNLSQAFTAARGVYEVEFPESQIL